MARVYEQNRWNRLAFDPEHCKAAVSNRERWGGSHQCARNPWKDGWCKQHHPDTEAQRAKETQERYERRQANSPSRKLADLRQEYEAILHQRDKLLEACKAALTYITEDDTPHTFDALENAVKLVEGEQ